MPRFKKTSRLTHRKHERKSKSATSGSEETDMVARKSSRVKKSPVVYQAPEPSSRVGRPSGSAKQPVIHRRIFGKDVDLQMECVEDELSPAQVKAMKEAQQEHDKANEMIKEVRAGNILVPSSQPNTFTIVPPKTSQTIPPAANLQQAPPPQQQMPPPAPPVPVEEAGAGVGHQGVPPPRPAQFLNKHVSEMKVTKPTQDVIVISSSAAPVGVKLTSTTQTVPTLQLQMAPMNSQGTIQAASLVPVSRNVPGGVMPQQVYKFVSLPSSIQTNVVHNQWALRPLLTVSPQQQSSVMGSNPQVLQHFAMTTTTAQKLGMRLAAPRPQQATVAQMVRSADFGNKRPASAEPLGEPAAKKRMNKGEVQDGEGNWIPLDEYYYGTLEGDPEYTEEKGEYRFKCWYCSKMLYNNVRAMQHIQGHIDASKQQNIDLSDLTQCKHCYKQFDTPFEMQTHVEKVHLSNKVLMCRICERDFTTQRELTVHMKTNHHACEMPYVCQLCSFRSSMYSDVVDHFKKKHDSSHYFLCLYCLRTFEVKFVSQGWGQTQTYYGHLLKHQTKSSTKKCVVCRLTFFNAMDVKTHRKNCHLGNQLDLKASNRAGKTEPGQSKKRGSQLKSLNAPSISRIQDYGTVIFPDETNRSKCIECKMMMSSTDHYKKYVHCTMCRFATSCSVAYAKHMMGFHSGQMSSLNMNIPWERPMKETMYCACGFKSSYGNKIANHLVFCGKWTCYSTKLQTSPEVASTSSSSAKVEEKKDGSLLGMLGLVSKDEVSPTEEEEGIISNKPRPESSKLSDTSVKKTAAIKVDKPKPKSKKLEAKLKEVENSGKSEKLSETGIEKSAEEDISNSMPDEIKETLTEKLKGTEEMDIDDAVKTGEKELEVETVDLTNREKDQKQDNDVIEILDESKATERKEDKTSAAMCEVEDAEDKSSEETRKDLDKEVCEVEETEEKSSKETRKDLDKETCAMEETEDKSREEARNDVEKDTSEEVSEDDQKGSVEKDLLNDDKIEKKIEMEVGEKVKDQDSDSKDTAVPQDAPEQMEVEVNASAVGDTKSDAPEIIQTPQSEEEVEETESKEDKSLSKGDSVADESVQKEDSGVDKGTEESSTKDTDGEMQNKKEMSIEDQKLETEENTEEAGKQPCDVETVEKVDIENIEDKSEAAKESEESKESDTIEQSKMTIPSEHGDLRDRERRESRSSDRSSSERVRRSSESERRSHERDRRSSDRDHHSSERERQHSGGRHDDHRQGNRPHHGSHRSDSYHGNRPYDRSHDRGQGHWQDNRGGYGGYHDNRGQGYRGGGGYRGQGGQFGGYQGNRGGHYQDRGRGGYQGNYNRNFQGRGGYNPNYRGGGYGGGYY